MENTNNIKTPATTNSLSVTLSNSGMVVARLEQRYAAVKTVKDAVVLQAQNPDEVKCLKRIVRESEDGGGTVKKTLAALLYATDKFLHLKEGLSLEEIRFTTESIIDEFGGQITFADIKVIFENAKRGNYGKMYERLSCATVMDWFRQYIDERLNTAEQHSISQARKTYGTQGVRTAPTPSQADIDKDRDYARYKAQLLAEKFKSGNND